MALLTTRWRFQPMPDRDYLILRDIATEAVGFFIERLAAAVKERGVASFVLAGGGTPQALYHEMAVSAENELWERVHVFWGDERLVPPDDPGSNFRAAHDALLSRVPIPAANIHRIKGELPAETAAADYIGQLRAWAADHDPGAPNPWPRFDLVLLGLGEDGHTASLFPGSPVAAGAPVIAVTADYQGRPAGRVTMTPLAFNDAHNISFLVSGAYKAGAVYDTFHIDDPVRFPAQRIRHINGNQPLWILDEQAASRLDWRPPR